MPGLQHNKIKEYESRIRDRYNLIDNYAQNQYTLIHRYECAIEQLRMQGEDEDAKEIPRITKRSIGSQTETQSKIRALPSKREIRKMVAKYLREKIETVKGKSKKRKTSKSKETVDDATSQSVEGTT